MKYTANKAYQTHNAANEYDRKRFYGIKGRIVNWREKKLITKAIQKCGIFPPAKILDVPTGTARLAIHLAKYGYDIVGVDISNEMIRQGVSKLKNSSIGNKITLEVGNGEKLSHIDSSFDISISLRLFGHTPPDIRTNILKELSRVSKSYVIVAYYSKHSLQAMLRKNWRLKNKVPWYSVNIREICKELKDANLEMIAISSLIPKVSETTLVIAKKL